MAPDSLTDPADALALVLGAARPLGQERVALADAQGRVLACDAHADLDQPAFDRATMDGIAVRATDCAVAGALLRDIGEARAGLAFDGTVLPQTCVRIMTGAVLPAGADAVVPVERIETLAGGHFRVFDAIAAEANLARRGSEVRAGEVVVEAGEVLGGARLGVLAAFGHAQAMVWRRPVVAVLATGDELVGADQTPGAGQIRDANSPAIAALARSAGADVRLRAVSADTREGLAAAIAAAWSDADVLVLSGGVSVGARDFVAAALADVGATSLVHRIRIKPGKPFLFATRGPQLAFGLPGNPVSAWVCATLFLAPALAALQGDHRAGWTTLTLPSRDALPAVGSRTEIAPARLHQIGGASVVEILPTRGSADLAHFARADLLAIRPAGDTALPAGALLQILWSRR